MGEGVPVYGCADVISALRFFVVAPLHSRYMWAAMAAVLMSGAAALILDPSRGADVLGPLALLQMLAASSGFAVAARRGHFDLLLTAGPGRVRVAVAHLVLSVLPGLLVWAVLGTLEALLARTTTPRAFAAGSVLSIGAISTLAWALSVRLPRLSGGIAWLLGIAVWIVGWSGGPTLAAVAAGRTDVLTCALVAMVCPFVLLGQRLTPSDAIVVLPLAAVTMLMAVGAVGWIVRMDVPLESAQ